MRRNDKELSDQVRISDILSNALFCHVAMSGSDGPYCVPMCFACYDGKILLHSANEGKKIDILLKNPQVCILIEQGTKLITAQTPCGYGMAYDGHLLLFSVHKPRL